ncbi:unnamed protein product [Cuscuta campestris]|uniref:Uncharacterized protein n=2 Tax=Cuscuta sect. Cleistogrammica TaxID=1824901 RepID=A0A484M6G1_9ASTE|nr:hypothetical protein DM860_001080 [Cuscuta australis]VFQ84432.1 unnamed protein product [Cuscuta campestris]
MMKGERQRWRPEEDSLVLSYVKQYGPKEWNLIPQRMGRPLDRDPKSCLERWKNYLKPGLKKGSLTPEEQQLLISLQAKYGNKWKKIAAEIPGRTAKRLGKWWEVFKEKEAKQQQQQQLLINSRKLPPGDGPGGGSPDSAAQGKYDHILETFAEKYVGRQQALCGFPSESQPVGQWMMNHPFPAAGAAASNSSSGEQICALVQHVKELEEGRANWMRHRKEAAWRMRRLEQQLEAEKGRKKREKMEEIGERIRRLRDEEEGFRGRVEIEYREGVMAVERDCEAREAELMEALAKRHVKLAKVVEQFCR